MIKKHLVEQMVETSGMKEKKNGKQMRRPDEDKLEIKVEKTIEIEPEKAIEVGKTTEKKVESEKKAPESKEKEAKERINIAATNQPFKI